MSKYRIVHNPGWPHLYLFEVRHWYWPFWHSPVGCFNSCISVEEAKSRINSCKRGKSVV